MTTRRERFLAERKQVMPWPDLLRLIAPEYPEAGSGRRPYPLARMLQVYLINSPLDRLPPP
jgi:IS5 family transposase